jgi:hypothetical protein
MFDKDNILWGNTNSAYKKTIHKVAELELCEWPTIIKVCSLIDPSITLKLDWFKNKICLETFLIKKAPPVCVSSVSVLY